MNIIKKILFKLKILKVKVIYKESSYPSSFIQINKIPINYNLEKNGYIFLGWKYKNKLYNFEKTIMDNDWEYDGNIIELIPHFEINKYKIELLDESENIYKTLKYTVEDQIELPSIYKNGYEFKSWTDNVNEYTRIEKGTTGDKVLKPTLEPIQYMIVYEDLISGNKINKYTILDSEPITIDAPNYDLAGYIFLGYYNSLNEPIDKIIPDKCCNYKIICLDEANIYYKYFKIYNEEIRNEKVKNTENDISKYIDDKIIYQVIKAVWKPIEYSIFYKINGEVIRKENFEFGEYRELFDYRENRNDKLLWHTEIQLNQLYVLTNLYPVTLQPTNTENRRINIAVDAMMDNAFNNDFRPLHHYKKIEKNFFKKTLEFNIDVNNKGKFNTIFPCDITFEGHLMKQYLLKDSEFYYEIINNSASISSCVCNNNKFSIPDVIVEKENTYNILSIQEKTFKNNDILEEIILPKFLKSLEKNTFESCRNLKSIVFPDQIENIDEEAFVDCPNIEYFNIPSKIRNLKDIFPIEIIVRRFIKQFIKRCKLNKDYYLYEFSKTELLLIYKTEKINRRVNDKDRTIILFVFDRSEVVSNPKSIFEKYKKEHPHLFLRNNFYFNLIDIDNLQEDGYKIYFLDDNYNLNLIPDFYKELNYLVNYYSVKNITNEIILMKQRSVDIFDCVNAYFGELEIYNVTQEKLDSIYDNIDECINNELKFRNILIEGPARSGKTVIAMQLLNRYKEFKFLIMNYHFYSSLKEAFKILEKDFPNNRIFHHDLGQRADGCGIDIGGRYNGWEKTFKFSTDYVIVDEAQRLADSEGSYDKYGNHYPGFNELSNLTLNPKLSIFLGDNKQRLNSKYDQGFDAIKDILRREKRKFLNYHFNETIGIPTYVVNSINYLIDNKSDLKDRLTNYEIKLYNNHDKFMEEFKSDNYSKHYVTLPNYYLPNSFNNCLSVLPFEYKEKGINTFLDEKLQNKYTYTTYEMISRELEYVYFIFPSSVTYDEVNGIYDVSQKLSKDFLYNHLYVNMTRAKKKLVIYTKDQALFDYLAEKIKILNGNTYEPVWDNSAVEEQKLNYILFSSDKRKLPNLIKILKSHGSSGVIHATDYYNVIKILKSDTLLSRNDAEGIFVDIAEQNVIVKTHNTIKSKIRFYLKSGTPTLFHFNQRTENLVILEFNFDLLKEDVIYSDGNAASRYSKFTGVVDEAIEFDWSTILNRGPVNVENSYEIIRKRNAEILLDGPMKVSKYLEKIIVNSDLIKNNLIEQFPNYKSIIIVDLSYFK